MLSLQNFDKAEQWARDNYPEYKELAHRAAISFIFEPDPAQGMNEHKGRVYQAGSQGFQSPEQIDRYDEISSASVEWMLKDEYGADFFERPDEELPEDGEGDLVTA